MEADADCQAEAVQGFLTATETLLQQFDTLAIKAEDSSPEALLPVIQEMEALTLSFEAETIPPCALQAQAALSEYFMRQIQGYLRLHAAALGVTPQSDHSALDEFQAANDKLARFNKLAHDLAVSTGLK